MDSHSPLRPHAVSSIKEFPEKDHTEDNPKSLSDVIGHRPVSSTDTQLPHLKTMDVKPTPAPASAPVTAPVTDVAPPTFGALVGDRGKSEYSNNSTYQHDNEKIPTVGDVNRIVKSFEEDDEDDDDDEVEYNMYLGPPSYNGDHFMKFNN